MESDGGNIVFVIWMIVPSIGIPSRMFQVMVMGVGLECRVVFVFVTATSFVGRLVPARWRSPNNSNRSFPFRRVP